MSSTQDSSSTTYRPNVQEDQEIKSSPKPPSPWAQDLNISGDESGDSEIEQVAEDSDSPTPDLTSKSPTSKGGFSQSSNPFEQTSYTSVSDKASNPFEKPQPDKVSPSNPFELSGGMKGGFGQPSNPPLYSLLREEREAELDSDLLIESASEESPKREQEYSAPKRPETSPLIPDLTSSKPISTSVPAPSPFIQPPASTLKEKEEEKEQEKEKEKTTPIEKPKPQPEDSWSTKPRPAVMGTSTVPLEQHSIQDEESKSKSCVESTTEEKDAAPPVFLQSINKQKGKRFHSMMLCFCTQIRCGFEN